MNKEIFKLKEDQEFIELIKLLKICGIAQTGGHGKILIEEGSVFLNDEQEFRKRKKLFTRDRIRVENIEITIE